MSDTFVSAIGATPESARTQIGAIGPSSEIAPLVGQVLTWNGVAWVPAGPGGGGGTGQGNFTIRPAGPFGSGVYPDWASMYLDLSIASPGLKWIFIDSPGVPVPVPLGTYILSGCILSGVWEGSVPSILTTQTGVIFSELHTVANRLQVVNEGTTSPLSISSLTNSSFMVQFEAQVRSAIGGAPFFNLLSGSVLNISCLDGGRVGDIGLPVVKLSTSAVLSTKLYNQSFFAADCVDPTSQASSSVSIAADAGSFDGTLTQVGYTGTYSLTQIDPASGVSYNDLAVAPPLGATDVQGALDALKIASVGVNGSSAIWRGVGAPVGAGIYNTWASLFAWAQSAPGYKRIYLDSTFGSLIVDPGVWSFTDPVEFIGSPLPPRTAVTFNEASFHNTWMWSNVQFLVLNTVGPPFGAFPETINFYNCDIVLSGGAQPFIRSLTAALDITFTRMAVAPTTQLVFDLQPTAAPGIIRLKDGTTVAFNSFSTAIPTTLTIYVDSSCTYLTQFFIFGTLILIQSSAASAVAYVPGNAANWAAPAPTNVSDALDRLAAANVLNGFGPVP